MAISLLKNYFKNTNTVKFQNILKALYTFTFKSQNICQVIDKIPIKVTPNFNV